MSQANGDFIEVKHPYPYENGDAEMFFPAGNTDLAPYVHANGHELHLFDSGFHSAKHRAVTYMGIRNDMLPLGSHNGRFKNLGKNIREFTTKINSNGTDALQACIAFLKQQDLPMDLQFVNYR